MERGGLFPCHVPCTDTDSVSHEEQRKPRLRHARSPPPRLCPSLLLCPSPPERPLALLCPSPRFCAQSSFVQFLFVSQSPVLSKSPIVPNSLLCHSPPLCFSPLTSQFTVVSQFPTVSHCWYAPFPLSVSVLLCYVRPVPPCVEIADGLQAYICLCRDC